MISFIYFLLASCFLIGCFANFAGNDYGYSLALMAASSYAVFLIPRGIYAAKKSWKKSRLFASRILAEHWLLVLGMFGIMMKFNHLAGAGIIMIAGFLPLSLIYFYQSVSAFFSWFRSGRHLAELVSFLMLLFCSAEMYTTLSKFMNWPGSLFALLAGIVFLVFILAATIAQKIWQPVQQEAKISHSPVRSYFFILMVGNLHFFGSIFGWVPGFQFPERPLNLSRMLEVQESSRQNSRVDCFVKNIDNFFLRRSLDNINPKLKQEISSDEPMMDSMNFCLP